MAENPNKLVRFVASMLPNIVWDGIKVIGGIAMVKAAWKALLAEYHRSQPDWLLVSVMFGGGLLLVLLGYWLQERKGREVATKNELPAIPDMPSSSSPSLLSTLQAEILQLTRALRAYPDSLGVKPLQPESAIAPEGVNQKKWVEEKTHEATRWMELNGEWTRKFLYGYQQEFAEKVERVMTSLGREGFIVAPLEPYTHKLMPQRLRGLVGLLLAFMVSLEDSESERRSDMEEKARRGTDLLLNPPPLAKAELFTTLQIEAFSLAKELRGFLKENPAPEDSSDHRQAYDPMLSTLNWFVANTVPWRKRIKAGYERRFEEKVKDLTLAYEELGQPDEVLSYAKLNGLNAECEKDISSIATHLILVAHRLDV